MATDIESAIAAACHTEWNRLHASVARITRDCDLAEDVVQDAFATALKTGRGTACLSTPERG
jgi:RNA polymerase sigma-70 factor (ECF subfamily)